MKQLTLIFLIIILESCSSKIRVISEYENKDGILIKTCDTEFDINGNEIKEVKYNLKSYNKVKTIIYQNNLKKSITELYCNPENNKSKINSFTNIIYDKDTNSETETMYVKDSLIWWIKEKKVLKRLEIIKTYSWDVEATKKPNYNDAFTTIDSLFYDKKNRLIKQVSYSKTNKKPFIDIYTYFKNGYFHKRIGTVKDTIFKYEYSKEQKKIVKYFPRFQFYYPKQFVYKIEYH